MRNAENENVQKGILRKWNITTDHLTASAGYEISSDSAKDYATLLNKQVGKTVYWQEYADAGAKFVIDGKSYVLVPFYRLIGFEED